MARFLRPVVAMLAALTVFVTPVFGFSWASVIESARPGIMVFSGTDDDPKRTHDDYCTTFMVAKGLVMTAAHCLEDKKDPFIGSYKITVNQRPATVEAVGGDIDIALLRIAPRPTDRVMRLASQSPRIGTPIAVVGYGYFDAFSSLQAQFGHVQLGTAASEQGETPYFLFVDAISLPGDSGGPILNSHGEVIGMTVQIFARMPIAHFSIGIGSPMLQAFLKAAQE